MRDSLIRWKLKDYRELERAVNSFNRKIKRLEKKSIPLPEPIEYVELRRSIKSRKELNRVIKSLEEFKKKGSEKIINLESGTTLTKWEYSEIKKARTRAKRRLLKEAIEIRKIRPIQLGMGDERLTEIESMLERFENLEKRKGFEFKRVKESILYQGKSDIELKKAETFKINFLESLKQASNFEGYDKLINKLNKIKNPIDFYNRVKKSQIAMDFGVWYNEMSEGVDTISYGAFATSQDMFNQMLMDFDIM